MYAYSKPIPFVRSSIPCNFATSVVLPHWLSPRNNNNVNVKNEENFMFYATRLI